MHKCRQKKYTTIPKKSTPLQDQTLRSLRGFRRAWDLTLCPGPEGPENSLYIRLRLLEGIIHDKTLEGDRKVFREALKEYLELWISLERGES